jgi:pimeloyl-ACP methyl ester carboxylesterase
MREPIVIVGGFLSAASDYGKWQRVFAASPISRRSFVVDIGRLIWATTQDDTFRPQLLAIGKNVEAARRATGAEKVWLVCHSAGGRISRLWMGDKPYGGVPCGGHPYVRGIIFLGSPYQTQEPWARRSTSFANTNYPGAFYPDVQYFSAIGKSVYGKRNGNIEQRLAYVSYRAVDPAQPEQWGDGVITLTAAHVPGATNHTLDGIYHGGILGRPSYISPPALRIWAQPLKDEL